MSAGVEFIVEIDHESANTGLMAETDGLSLGEKVDVSSLPNQGISTGHILEPVAFTIAVTTLSVLAYRIVEHWLRRDEFGVQIDARSTPPIISSIAGVPNGFVIVISPEGEVQKFDASALDGNTLTDLLAGIASKG